jgi:hypothetical protein
MRPLSGDHKDLTTPAAISTDKGQLLNDQPTVIVQRSFQELKPSIEARGARFVPAEVVEEASTVHGLLAGDRSD